MASLAGEFTIDFRSEPLKSAGIFAITGNTGSGKSTLLDTMCIALFNESPRTKKVVGSSKLPDSKEETIHENDPRNILRRGCSEGYAECDFRALDGKEYRARWSVRRANNKPGGRLQNYTYSLHRLDDGSELQGTKSELLEKVKKLIGLTFDQFTRAVLLAQGDFATFLKASSREKSEILEKLTGTDIYSQISIKIFNKSKEADKELEIISARMGEITLLSDDELRALTEERSNLETQKEHEEKSLKIIEKKLDWIERMQALSAEEKSAQESLAESQKALEALRPTIEQLDKIESTQPIRDTYTNILALKKELKESEAQSLQLKEKEKIQAAALCSAEEQHKKLIEQQSHINNEWNSVQPKIREALKIETEQQINTKKLTEYKKEIKNCAEQQSHCNATIESLTKENAALQKELQTILEWKKAHESLKSVSTNIETTLSDISEAAEATTLIKEKNSLLATSQKLLKRENEQLAAAQAEGERLSRTLTQEIATLRQQLVEGKPCPVCGSCHHETSAVGSYILQEELLIQAKRRNQETIDHLSKSIEHHRTEITALSASIEGYTNIYNNKLRRAAQQLHPLLQSSSPTLQELGELARTVKETATEWQQKETQYTEAEHKKQINEATLSATEKRRKEVLATILEKEKSINTIQEEIALQDKKHSQLIGNNSAEGIEQEYQKRIERINNAINKSSDERNNLLITLEKSRQQIDTLNKNIRRRESEFQEHKQQIEEFLASVNPPMTLEELHKIATTPAHEITRMRTLVNETNNRLLQAATMLDERRRNIRQHQSLETRPDKEETPELLLDNQQSAKASIKQHTERLTQITAALRNDEANKKQTRQLRKEYDEANNRATDWKKLNTLLGSSDGNKFRMIAQGYTLDIMLSYANKHLAELSERYRLARISSETLAIKVIDLDMMSETRSVHSLSGGESFLVSLALALALSSLSSNKMSIESLFIDEGFGSLDSETLSVAMDALERLHSTGRRIGIISHLAEIIERIPTQIHVIKSKEGKSKIEIIG